jgi:type I restriction enzyme, S subunit
VADGGFTEQQFIRLQKYKILPGDIVLTRKGSIGKARVVPDGIVHGIADSDTVRVRFDRHSIDLAFIVELLHSAPYVQNQLEVMRRGAILGGLNTATIGNIEIALPPLQEQSQLIQQLRADTRAIARVLETVEREIGLLRQYRMRLVADLVTGKLDVREASSNLSNEAEDIAPLDTGEELEDAEGTTDRDTPDEETVEAG